MNDSLAAPRLIVHGFNDGAVLYDVVEAADAGGVVADVLRADEARAPGHGVGGGAWREVVVRAANPIDAEVRHAGHLGVELAQRVYVVRAEFGLEALRAEEGRIADDDIGLRPLRADRL